MEWLELILALIILVYMWFLGGILIAIKRNTDATELKLEEWYKLLERYKQE